MIALNNELRVEDVPVGCDGVICLGGVDWWYHNRGHFDLQVMTRLAKDVPVLYVNSIGMRRHARSEGKVWFGRFWRKLKSCARGLRRVDSQFWVYSPWSRPGRFGRVLDRLWLSRSIRLAARRAGIRRPLVWVACPRGAEVVDELRPAAVVFQRTDYFEAFDGVNRERCLGWVDYLLGRADLTLYCCAALQRRETFRCQAGLYVDHGVDFGRFCRASDDVPEPDVLSDMPRPRVGFVGGLDSHTFDSKLFEDVVRGAPDLQFLLVGGSTLPNDWSDHPNVVTTGRVPHDEVDRYMRACDVLIMPWRQTPWIEYCHPVKLKEYLAVGRPVVSTPFAELNSYLGLVHVADDAPSFLLEIREALAADCDPRPGQRRVAGCTWEAKVEFIEQALVAIGVRLSKSSPAALPNDEGMAV